MRRSSRAAAARSCKNPHDPDSLRDDPDSVSFLLHLTSRLSLSRVPVGKIRSLSSQRPGPPEGARAGPAVLRTWSNQREASFFTSLGVACSLCMDEGRPLFYFTLLLLSFFSLWKISSAPFSPPTVKSIYYSDLDIRIFPLFVHAVDFLLFPFLFFFFFSR